MRGRRGACEVVDFCNLVQIIRTTHGPPRSRTVRLCRDGPSQSWGVRPSVKPYISAIAFITHSGPGASEEVVKHRDLMAEEHEPVHKVEADKTGTTRH